MDCSRIENSNMNGFLPVKYIVNVLWKLISGEMEYMVLLLIIIAKNNLLLIGHGLKLDTISLLVL